MDFHFSSLDLQRLAESATRCSALLGERDGAALRQRLCELAAAENLATVKTLPALALQQIGQHGRRFSVRVSATYRLTFEPVGSFASADRLAADLSEVTAIRLVAVEKT